PEPGVARKATRIAVAEAKRDRALPAEVLEPRRSPAGPQAVALVQPLRPLDARRAQHRQLVGGQRNRTAIGPAREEGLVEAHALAALEQRGGDPQAPLVDADLPRAPGQRVGV